MCHTVWAIINIFGQFDKMSVFCRRLGSSGAPRAGHCHAWGPGRADGASGKLESWRLWSRHNCDVLWFWPIFTIFGNFSDFWKYAMLPFQGCIFLVNIDPSAHPEHEPCQICIIVLIDCIQQVRNFGFVSEIHVLHPTTIGCRGFLLGP